MGLLIYLINLAFNIYIFIIILQVLISWLIVFDVINTGNKQAQNLIALLKRATDPLFKPIQKFIPPIGGIDITPIIAILGLSILSSVVTGLLLSITGYPGYGYGWFW